MKLRDDGKVIDLTMMQILPKSVYNDIWEEEWLEIANTKWTLDLGKLRKNIATRCYHVLHTFITNSFIVNRG